MAAPSLGRSLTEFHLGQGAPADWTVFARERGEARAKRLKRNHALSAELRPAFLEDELAKERFGSSTRDDAYALKLRIRSVAVKTRVRSCLWKRVASTVTVAVRPTDGIATCHGVASCGSVWACPVCARKILTVRAGEVSTVVQAHVAAGGGAKGRVLMATLTQAHSFGAPLKRQRAGVAKAWRKVQGGKRWELAKERWGVEGYIRALEVNNGPKGWHSHLHVLFFLTHTLSAEEMGAFRRWLAERWQREIVCQLGEHSRPRLDSVGVDLRICNEARYISKLGLEIASVTGKENRAGLSGYRSPWRLAEDASRGEATGAAAWREYQIAMHGARKLTWSRGLRRRYIKHKEQTDDEIIAGESQGAVPIVELTAREWDDGARRIPGMLVQIFRACEGKGTEQEREARALEIVAQHAPTFGRKRKYPPKAERRTDEPKQTIYPPRAARELVDEMGRPERVKRELVTGRLGTALDFRAPPAKQLADLLPPMDPLPAERIEEIRRSRATATEFSWEKMAEMFAIYESHGAILAAEHRRSSAYRHAVGFDDASALDLARRQEIDAVRSAHAMERARLS